MKILLLSPYPEALSSAFSQAGDEFIATTTKLTLDSCTSLNCDFIVSYGYRHVLSPDVVNFFRGKCVNLHISLLPYSRGSHPLVWSIYESNPLGVTIHNIDYRLDTGNILFQQIYPYKLSESETFATLYRKVNDLMIDLFCFNWKYIRSLECSGWSQLGYPTIHKSKDLDMLSNFLPKQWDTSIYQFCKLAGISSPSLPS